MWNPAYHADYAFSTGAPFLDELNATLGLLREDGGDPGAAPVPARLRPRRPMPWNSAAMPESATRSEDASIDNWYESLLALAAVGGAV